jgi:WD40 repeat protein
VYLYLGVFGSYRVEIYRVLTGEKVNTFEVGAGGRFSLSSTLFASNHMGIFSNHREILEVFSGSKMPKIKTEGWGLSFSYDDRFVASMSNDEVKLWSVQSGKLLKTIKKERDNWFKEIAFSPVGPYLFVCSYNKIMVFDLSFSNNIRKTRETAAHAQKLAISLDGSLIAAAEWKEICIFEVSSFRLTSSLTLSETIDQIDLSPNGRILVSTSGEKVSYWKIPSGNLLFTLEKRRSAPLPFAFSPDNSLVVTTSEDGSIDIRESESGRIIRNIDARANLEDVPRIIQFSNAGNILALATEDKTLSLWWLGSPKSTH